MSLTAKSRILAVDYGDARTGLAATDWTGTIAVPLPRIDSRDQAEVVRAIVELCAERDTEALVVGMPLTLDGTPGERAQHTQTFVDALRKATELPVATVDESHTTDEAHARLKQGGMKAKKRKDFADSVSALVILERYRELLRRG
ncbi:MAG: Holliday junction resolvase RuvX [Planctomycetes bacterium]|nr:Holliday junction resolvase RuvX [Planctomycetota bacterium]